jgi:alginate O-acetyltransferase complex protein AlgI
MIFTELRFLVFFLIVFFTYWAIRGNRARKVFLLLGSYVFYGAWDYRFLSLILASTCVDFVVGLKLGDWQNSRRTRWLLCSLTLNLGLLAVFKYFNFFVDSLNALLLAVGIDDQLQTLQIVLPVGISFYTFQTLSYTIDVYRRQLHPTRDFLDFALFVAFFPQLVAGPIVRATDFLGQLVQSRLLARVDFRWCLVLFLCGFFKKACISDNLSVYVDAFYQNPSLYDFPSLVVCILLYSIQIYCDFSGYSDMAIATAGLLGYRLRENFNFPYLASNITDFWRRWHMSLSTWLRDYLYIPLGGNRKGPGKAKRNLMITMLLGGLWHGASWNFVLWGGLHGLGLVVHRMFTSRSRTILPAGPRIVAGWFLTFAFVTIAWIPFRSQSFADTSLILLRLAGLNGAGDLAITADAWILWLLLAVLLVCHGASRLGLFIKLWRNVNATAFVAGYALAWVLALSLRSMSSVPFIYFQF